MHFRQQRGGAPRRRAAPPLVRLRPRVFQKTLHRVVAQRLRVPQQFVKGLHPAPLYKTVRVLPRRQKQKRHAFSIPQGGQDSLQSAPRRRASGVVAVKGENHIVRRPRRLFHLRRRRRRPHRRHRFAKARLRKHHRVHITLADNQPIPPTRKIRRLRQAKQRPPLGKQGRFRRVQILRLFVAQSPPAKSHQAGWRSEYRKHHPPAKIIIAPPLFLPHQPGAHNQVAVIVRQKPLQSAPVVRRKTQRKPRRRLPRHSPPFQILPRLRGFRKQAPPAPQGGLQQPRHVRRRLFRTAAARAPFARDVHPHALRQSFHPGDKVPRAFGFYDEVQGGAVRAAAEAVVESPLRIDRKGRRFFRVKRAEPEPVVAAPF